MASLAVRLFTVLCISTYGAGIARAQLYVRELAGEESGLRLGSSLCSIGDLDADGRDDVVVGSSPSLTSHYGLVHFLSVPTGHVIRTIQSGIIDDAFGHSVASLGDVDQDGVSDVAVGAPATRRPGTPVRGVVRVYSGRTGAPLYTLPTDPTWPHGGLGRSLACAGDIDHDGILDVIAGAAGPSGFDSGAAVVFSGRDGALLFVLQPPAHSGAFGWSVTGPGDLDHDGWPDLAVGAPIAAFPFRGAVFVYSGRDGSILRVLDGPSAYSLFGTVAPAGDVDQDLHADLAVGAPQDSSNGPGAGKVTVYSGSTFGVLRVLDGFPHAAFGASIASGDIDGDGWVDLAIGTPDAFSAGAEAGALFLYSGRDGSGMGLIPAWQAGEHLGLAAIAGDANGDGSRDLVVAAPGTDRIGDDAGSVRTFLLGHAPPQGECFPTFNSFNCGSSLTYTGTPSFSIGDPFVVTSTYIINRQPGWVVWGLAGANVPFGGGTLCVQPRVIGPAQNSGGSEFPGTDCSGVLVCRFSPAYLAAHGIGPGQEVHVQFLSREPHFEAPFNIMLSDAVYFPVVP